MICNIPDQFFSRINCADGTKQSRYILIDDLEYWPVACAAFFYIQLFACGGDSGGQPAGSLMKGNSPCGLPNTWAIRPRTRSDLRFLILTHKDLLEVHMVGTSDLQFGLALTAPAFAFVQRYIFPFLGSLVLAQRPMITLRCLTQLRSLPRY